jgi:hypothetical protein
MIHLPTDVKSKPHILAMLVWYWKQECALAQILYRYHRWAWSNERPKLRRQSASLFHSTGKGVGKWGELACYLEMYLPVGLGAQPQCRAAIYVVGILFLPLSIWSSRGAWCAIIQHLKAGLIVILTLVPKAGMQWCESVQRFSDGDHCTRSSLLGAKVGAEVEGRGVHSAEAGEWHPAHSISFSSHLP